MMPMEKSMAWPVTLVPGLYNIRIATTDSNNRKLPINTMLNSSPSRYPSPAKTMRADIATRFKMNDVKVYGMMVFSGSWFSYIAQLFTI